MINIENKVKDISNNYYGYLMEIENVNGVAYGYKIINGINTFIPCIKVFVSKKVKKNFLTPNNIIPSSYMGIETDVYELKEVFKNTNKNENINTKNVTPYSKIRPLQGGSSIGVINDTGSGSICCIVKKNINIASKSTKDLTPKNEIKTLYYLLSNAHVIAENNAIPIGTSIFQPSPVFLGNDINNMVGVLDTYIPLKSLTSGNLQNGMPTNTVDCAIAKLKNSNLKSNKVLQIGEITGVRKPELGMNVKKVGAKTGLTRGKILALHVTRFLTSDLGKEFFKDLILSDLFAEGGDSGCPILTADNEIVAMHIAGDNNQSTSNDINTVLKELNVEVYLG